MHCSHLICQLTTIKCKEGMQKVHLPIHHHQVSGRHAQWQLQSSHAKPNIQSCFTMLRARLTCMGHISIIDHLVLPSLRLLCGCV